MTTLTGTNEAIITLYSKIETEKSNINFSKLAIIDWSNRVYKTSNKTVTDSMTEGDKYFGMSTDFINENRRSRTINGLKEDIKGAKDRIAYFTTMIAKEERELEDEYYKANPVVIETIDGLDDLESLFGL